MFAQHFRISRDFSEERSRNFQDRPHARPLHGCGHRGGLGRSHYRDGHGRGFQGVDGKPWEKHRKNHPKAWENGDSSKKKLGFPWDSGDLWLIHDSEVGENGVADYSHFIGTWWLTIWIFGYPMSRHIHFFGGKRPTLRGNMSIYHEPNAKPSSFLPTYDLSIMNIMNQISLPMCARWSNHIVFALLSLLSTNLLTQGSQICIVTRYIPKIVGY